MIGQEGAINKTLSTGKSPPDSPTNTKKKGGKVGKEKIDTCLKIAKARGEQVLLRRVNQRGNGRQCAINKNSPGGNLVPKLGSVPDNLCNN